jgi:VanZ family protein
VPWIPAALWAALIFVLSSVPGQSLPPLPAWNFDKVVHALVYAILGGLCLLALRRGSRLSRGRAVALAALAATLYGISDELHQLLTPGRSADVLDVVADAVGAIVGAIGSRGALASSTFLGRRPPA